MIILGAYAGSAQPLKSTPCSPHRRSQKLELGGADWGPNGRKSRPKAESGECSRERGIEPPSHQLEGLGNAGSSPSEVRDPGRKRIFGHEKDLKMHVVVINFVSFTAQICIHKMTTKVGELGPPGRSPLTAPLTTPLVHIYKSVGCNPF